MKKIVLAIDSFKGCLSSKEIEQCIAEEIHRILPSCQTVCIPIADGGEGMLDTLIEATQGTFVSTQAHDPLMRIRPARYGILGDQRTAIIEMAEINGLTTLSPIERNPMKTSTYGTGELIKDALEKGFRRFIIGIGGSATNDAGMGMIQALGAHLYDKQGNELGQGGKIMEQIAHIDLNHLHPALKEATFIVACDVQNPFCGPQGAAYVFARQKGASEEQIRQLDEGMRHLALLIERDFSYNINKVKGSGAAGGLGGAFATFLQAHLQSGIDLLLNAVDFDRKITNADWIITGEGKADRQTAEGKVPAGVLKRAKKANIPVMLIAGKVEDKACLKQMGFARIVQISPDTLPLEEAMRPEITRENIQRAIGRELIVNNE
ncbi:glycerate kinase family protein [Phocaeicola salanitronis]|uniref:glycerate kinase family protein n=1 Tax=Phocaeicola salanitronis TaxID=376805 RepID=UPI0025A3D1C0|nr:glycerate kinase [Phocaeicola salanitronis]MDM8305081.1 glycerate kinase [Phocaeicola salanitronis]